MHVKIFSWRSKWNRLTLENTGEIHEALGKQHNSTSSETYLGDLEPGGGGGARARERERDERERERLL